MAVIKFVKAFRGITRHNLKSAQRHLASLSAYNNSHAELIPALFSPAQQATVEAMIPMLQDRLDQLKQK